MGHWHRCTCVSQLHFHSSVSKKLDMENRKQSFGRPLPAESCPLAGLFCLRTHLRRSACAPPGKSCILLGELPRTHVHTLCPQAMLSKHIATGAGFYSPLAQARHPGDIAWAGRSPVRRSAGGPFPRSFTRAPAAGVQLLDSSTGSSSVLLYVVHMNVALACAACACCSSRRRRPLKEKYVDV